MYRNIIVLVYSTCANAGIEKKAWNYETKSLKVCWILLQYLNKFHTYPLS